MLSPTPHLCLPMPHGGRSAVFDAARSSNGLHQLVTEFGAGHDDGVQDETW